MAELMGCQVPEELFYNVEKHVWARPEAGGIVTVGVTDVAQALAGKVIVVTPKAVGRSVDKNKPVATVESGKWVGPVPAPLGGQVAAVNEALKRNPGLVNQDPYGEGWIVRMLPANWEGDRADLVTGAEGVAAYRARLERDGLKCGA